MFFDFAKIYVKAGNGGRGCISFHRERFIPRGGPDGGDGGKGGDICFIADFGKNTLSNFRFQKKFLAENGSDGRGNNCAGKSGANLIIKVPKGTVIYNAKNKALIAEVVSNKHFIVVARGGVGGFGNARFKNAVRQSPRFAKPGYVGQEMELFLELKLLADVGLIGLPNVGKSTLLSKITAAKPKIADYAFTTLEPVLGVVNFQNSSFVVADVPGLIKGASSGLGLGVKFLKHLQKCRVLVHMIDVSKFNVSSPEHDFETINEELRNYDIELIKKPQILVASKVDLKREDRLKNLKKLALKKGFQLVEISALNSKGLKNLIKVLHENLQSLPYVEEQRQAILNERENRGFKFEIKKIRGTFVVESQQLERILQTSSVDSYENLQYFQKLIKKTGIEAELKAKGIRPGDLVQIHGLYFEYLD